MHKAATRGAIVNKYRMGFSIPRHRPPAKAVFHNMALDAPKELK